MTTTETTDMTPPAPQPVRRLRRSRTDRIGAGVAGGLGDYFRVDPVLFRVLFATAAFFGGAGVLGYLLAWAAIPEAGTEKAAIDGWVGALRRRRIPVWLIAAAAVFLFWLIAFSWWAPGPFVPVIIVVIVLVAILGRRARHDMPPPPPMSPPGAPTVSLAKDDAPTDPSTDPSAQPSPAPSGPPAWVGETRTWMREARESRRARLRRALPVKITTLVTLVVAMVVLGLVDAARGITLTTYFWFALAILGTGLIVGLAMRRASWSIALLLVPTIIAVIGFAGTNVSLRDGIGQKQWKPVASVGTEYKLAFGQGVLDLRSLAAQSSPSHVRIDVAAGQVEILAPKTLNLTVQANVRFGDISVDGHSFHDGPLTSHGVNVNRTIDPPTGATGPEITVDVHLSDGNINLRRS